MSESDVMLFKVTFLWSWPKELELWCRFLNWNQNLKKVNGFKDTKQLCLNCSQWPFVMLTFFSSIWLWTDSREVDVNTTSTSDLSQNSQNSQILLSSSFCGPCVMSVSAHTPAVQRSVKTDMKDMRDAKQNKHALGSVSCRCQNRSSYLNIFRGERKILPKCLCMFM